MHNPFLFMWSLLYAETKLAYKTFRYQIPDGKVLLFIICKENTLQLSMTFKFVLRCIIIRLSIRPQYLKMENNGETKLLTAACLNNIFGESEWQIILCSHKISTFVYLAVFSVSWQPLLDWADNNDGDIHLPGEGHRGTERGHLPEHGDVWEGDQE